MPEESNLRELPAFLDLEGNDLDKLTHSFGIDPLTDLAGCSLVGLDFAHATLKNVDFSNCDLTNAKLDFSDLTAANFDGARVVGVSFKNAIVEKIYWGNAKVLECDFSGTGIDQDFFEEGLHLDSSSKSELGELVTKAVGPSAFELIDVAVEIANNSQSFEQNPVGATVLREEILQHALAQRFVHSESLNWDEVRARSIEFNLNEHEALRVQFILLVMENIHTENLNKLEATKREKEEEEREYEEESESASEEDGEDGEDEFEISDKNKGLLKKYSFQDEISVAFDVGVERIPLVGLLYRTGHAAYHILIAAFDMFKSAVKNALRFLGFENVFLLIDWIAKSSRIGNFLVKLTGTIMLPLLTVVTVVFALTRFSNNPVRSLAKWFSREFDIKIPGEESE